MKHILLYGICLTLLWSCSYNASVNVNATNADEDKKAVAALLDSLNAAAAKANHSQYFSYFADSAVFAGTDATERWHKASFMTWSKPYFDRGKAWNFTAAQRHIYLGKDGHTAWFDELLNTQMKICRGSGVVTKNNGQWKIEQYILSMTLPNRLVDTIVALKKVEEDSILNSLKQ